MNAPLVLAPPFGFRRTWIDYTVEVDASEDELYALLSDISGWPSWSPGLRSLKRWGKGPWAPGARFSMVLSISPLPPLWLPCQLWVLRPGYIEWGGGALGSLIRHRFELTALSPTRTRLRHVEYASNALALVLLPLEKLFFRYDERWSNAIQQKFADRRIETRVAP